MHEEDPAIAAQLAALKAAFRERLAEDLAAFSEPLAEARQPPPLHRLRALAARAHRLAGAAGSFDEAALSEAAARFAQLCEEEAPDAAEIAQALYQLVLEAERVLEAQD
ncbi:MAG TPA: Hpt domain-containing protein [Kiloniellales bacterium]|nr:Hpt domain-containing protein [Kiloniellales bacterium]